MKPLLDGLAHRIQVERLVPAVGADVAEQLQSAALGRGGEREERQVRLVAPGRHRLGEQRLGIGHLGIGVDLRLGQTQHPPQFCGRFAGLRRVRLVHDHRIVALGQRPDLVEDERELLQRCHDDAGLLTGQRRGELRRVLVDPLHHPQGVLELVDGVLQLPVEDAKVGDDHHLVEHLDVAAGVQRRQPVRQPGDRVGLARPGRVLHQIATARPVLLGVGLQAPHRVPLVEPREDHLRAGLRTLRRLLHVEEPTEDVHPGVAGPHLLPQVAGAVPVGIRRVAGTEVMAPVERQEPGLPAGEAGGHRHRGRIDREVHHAHPAESPVGVGAIRAVLGDCVLDGLTGQRVLQLRRRHRNPVDEQTQIDGPGTRRIERQLPGHRQHVRLVELRQLRRQAMGRPEERQPDGEVAIHRPTTQHVHRPPPVQLRRQPLHEPRLRLVRVAAISRVHETRPLLTLRRPDELEQIGRVHTRHGVEVSRPNPCVADLRPAVPAMLHQPRGDVLLERRLGHPVHAVSPTPTRRSRPCGRVPRSPHWCRPVRRWRRGWLLGGRGRWR